jgi:RNA polymerase sigma-70 factor (ECF subfamily)
MASVAVRDPSFAIGDLPRVVDWFWPEERRRTNEVDVAPRLTDARAVESRELAALAPSEGDLMQRIAAGDEDAYRSVIERHLHGVHAFAHRILGNRAEAEEVSQETFLRVWRQADRYVSRAKLSTWIYRIAHNLAVDQLRRRRGLVAVIEVDELPASERSELSQRELQATVGAALAELPERQRTALALVHYQGMSNAEAAEVLGLGLRALESLLARGRRTLRERLATLESEAQ